MTVKLQDVAVLLGLHINGPPVIGTDERDWVGECDRLLGVMPPLTANTRWTGEADVIT